MQALPYAHFELLEVILITKLTAELSAHYIVCQHMSAHNISLLKIFRVKELIMLLDAGVHAFPHFLALNNFIYSYKNYSYMNVFTYVHCAYKYVFFSLSAHNFFSQHPTLTAMQ